MYKEKMVVSLKTKEGKIIREQGDVISLPFGSEYSIYLKNLESRKAQVKVSIDGTDVLDGKVLLIDANDTAELEGFLKDTIAKNSFKFIEKTQEISDYRGDKIDDSLIRVEFVYEKMKPVTQTINTVYNNTPYWTNNTIPKHIDIRYGNDIIFDNCKSLDCSLDSLKSKSINSMNINLTNSLTPSSLSNISLTSFTNNMVNDSGITVKGSEIKQEFKYGKIGELEDQSHVIIIHLKGYKEDKNKVEKVVTVKDKLQCSTCGKVSKSDAKYCDRCGTYLE